VFVWALLVIVRVALGPFTRPPSKKIYEGIESTLQRLSDAVAQVDQKLQTDSESKNPVLLEKVSSLMSELSVVRNELFSMKDTGALRPLAPIAATIVPSIGVVAEESKPLKEAPKPSVKVIVADSREERPVSPTPEMPESLTDNPWITVLAERKSKHTQAGGP
jgi:hypothetical protein